MAKVVKSEAFGLTKNFSTLCIYLILKRYSDENHPLTQEKIGNMLRDIYGISMERQAIGRIIDTINEDLGIDICKAKRKGSWYADADDLEPYERQLIIDALFFCRYVPGPDTKRLIDKLCKQTSEYFVSNVKYTYSTDNLAKNYNRSIFWNIEQINTAIAKHKCIKFVYNHWGTDKKLHKTKTHVVSPYRLVVHAGKYYLKGHCEGTNIPLFNYRLDFITDLEIVQKSKITDIRSFKGFESGLGNEKMGSNLPYMYADKEKRISFLLEEYMAHDVIDWLGDTVTFSNKKRPDGRIEATIITSPNALKWWFLQYPELEVTAPIELVDDVKKEVQRLAKTYK